jgi:hypothetical protein
MNRPLLPAAPHRRAVPRMRVALCVLGLMATLAMVAAVAAPALADACPRGWRCGSVPGARAAIRGLERRRAARQHARRCCCRAPL